MFFVPIDNKRRKRKKRRNIFKIIWCYPWFPNVL